MTTRIMRKIQFRSSFKALANRFWLTSKNCSGLNKVAHSRPSNGQMKR